MPYHADAAAAVRITFSVDNFSGKLIKVSVRFSALMIAGWISVRNEFRDTAEAAVILPVRAGLVQTDLLRMLRDVIRDVVTSLYANGKFRCYFILPYQALTPTGCATVLYQAPAPPGCATIRYTRSRLWVTSFVRLLGFNRTTELNMNELCNLYPAHKTYPRGKPSGVFSGCRPCFVRSALLVS